MHPPYAHMKVFFMQSYRSPVIQLLNNTLAALLMFQLAFLVSLVWKHASVKLYFTNENVKTASICQGAQPNLVIMYAYVSTSNEIPICSCNTAGV